MRAGVDDLPRYIRKDRLDRSIHVRDVLDEVEDAIDQLMQSLVGEKVGGGGEEARDAPEDRLGCGESIGGNV